MVPPAVVTFSKWKMLRFCAVLVISIDGEVLVPLWMNELSRTTTHWALAMRSGEPEVEPVFATLTFSTLKLDTLLVGLMLMPCCSTFCILMLRRTTGPLVTVIRSYTGDAPPLIDAIGS